MVNEEWKQEFVKTGYAVVSANVQQGTYPPDKNYEAIRWLARSDPARKAYKEARDTLKNARIIARRMRIALALSAISDLYAWLFWNGYRTSERSTLKA